VVTFNLLKIPRNTCKGGTVFDADISCLFSSNGMSVTFFFEVQVLNNVCIVRSASTLLWCCQQPPLWSQINENQIKNYSSTKYCSTKYYSTSKFFRNTTVRPFCTQVSFVKYSVIQNSVNWAIIL
jgi:hypothetical protein